MRALFGIWLIRCKTRTRTNVPAGPLGDAVKTGHVGRVGAVRVTGWSMDPSAEPVQRERSKRALIVTALAASIAGACSHSSRGQADGGLTGAGRGSGENAPGAPLAGRHSFDVLATLSLGDVVPPSSLQSPVPFTLVLDADAGLAFVGALGGAAELPVTKGASGDLGLGDFSVNVASPISTSI